ncbi:MAG: PEP-utilizing enzyme [Solidesulfovibrio sp.]|uniref:PEP-utilizing enzyme n=1 Tax=Solidesulfovibrio sp. TaxID=2910990 RepID=UPI002B1EBD12|nr:PEP-utilizing enzyme [Solidesulfovibrio sp.]MEA4857606.1 PEP-utilizing enzyme [Solidesulfovibrio sp.]
MPFDATAGRVRPDAPAGDARAFFSKFQALLEANTAALAAMAGLERMLGGEYVFDRAFLEKSAREVTDFAHQAVYALNAMTGNRHIDLYDRFMALAAAVEDILAGRPEPGDDALLRPLHGLRLEDRPKVGRDAAALGELAGRLGLPVPRGFVVTPAAWDEAGGLVPTARQALAEALEDPESAPESPAVTVSATAAAPGGEPVTLSRAGVPALAEPLAAALEELGREVAAKAGTAARPSATVLATPPAVARGRLRTAFGGPDGAVALRFDLWAEDDPARPVSLYFDRAHPFARTWGEPNAQAAPGAWPGLSPQVARSLAGQGLAAERLLGGAVEMGFCLEPSGAVAFESARLLPFVPLPERNGPAAAPILCGGEPACLGAASGVVVHVSEATAPETLPYGAVAVARSASPALAALLRRAGAVVAEVGDAVGHLAAIAREYRTPALFGLPGAVDALPEGRLVTVDAEAGCVLAGAGPIRPAPDGGLSPDDPEYLVLRRLLRRIAVLHATDPGAPDFSAAGCRTLHDILHFAHDRAVAVLADLRQAGVSERLATALPLPVPLDLRVLDIGGALAPKVAGLDSVRSRPLAAVLAGLLAPGMWDTAPARVGLGDILGAMARPLPDMRGNLAIAARGYCNLSLRLGYHFTVIDAYVCGNPEKNTIAFRFVGGLADAAGKNARTAFLRRILARCDFKVETAGDLVTARRKMVEDAQALEGLRLLGALCAFARQRDTELSGPDAAQSLERAFLAAWGEVRP